METHFIHTSGIRVAYSMISI